MCACTVFVLLELVVKAFGVASLISLASCQLPTNLERAQILEAHLRIREDVWPPASNMMLMEYSMELEHLADYWASRCEFEHPDSRIFPHYHDLGQNLAIFGSLTPTFTEAVCGYNKERKYYHYHNHSCTGRCGHYTQMVWATSNQLGCAMRRCDGLRSDWGNPQYLSVCQYKPDGNIRGRKPYEFGRSCGKCPEGYFCLRNQCAKEFRLKKAYPLMRFKKSSVRDVPKCKVYR
ncbi:unnamed protein product [Hydatigera taeniaeformis]|uniref:SCP domain-containing protein n=1 Tax=Hydatigena taeniaeformis TaxID=6205 RepID=A0A0R3XBB1_HYDTA|nr:unnamed protein product [Hydatigera taeniaeformis]